MINGFKYRIYPNKLQREFISKQIGASRKIYNLLLDNRFKIYEETKDIPKEEQKKIKYPNYTFFKDEYPW